MSAAGGRAVVIGATGAIGGAFVEAIAARGTPVLALSRRRPPALPPGADWHEADLLDGDSLARAARAAGAGLSLVIVATGLLHEAGLAPERDWRELEADRLLRSYAVNAVGPALAIRHFAPLLARDGRPLMACLSARVGSITDNRLGGWYGYRAAKAALNQIIATAAIELARKNRAAAIVGLHPGTVESPLSAPFGGGPARRFTPQESVGHLLAVLDRLGPAESGAVFDWKGERVPA